MLDSNDTARRLSQCGPNVEMRLLPATGHYLPGQVQAVFDFLTKPAHHP